MLTPQRIQDLSDPIESIYIAMTNELMVNIGKHITKPTWTHTAKWEIQKLSELGQLTQENAAIINKWIKALPQEIRDTMEETRRIALEDLEKQMERAAKRGYVTPPERDSTIDVLREYSQQAADQLNLVNTTMLASSVSQYERLVQMTEEETRKLLAKQEATQTILNEAAGNVAVGTETRTQALQRAIRRISEEGLTGFYDRAGRSWSPEAYVNMDIRTTVHNVAIQSVKNRMEDYNTEVFQVSAHAGARPLCYPYQGKLYSWNNTAGEIELGDGKRMQYAPLNSTSYGEPAGLFGINCGHYPIPMIPGVSIPHAQDFVQPKELNDKVYAESQEQRALERQIREAKRAVEMGDDSKEAKDRVKAAQAQMREFIDRTGRTRRYDRESLYGAKKTPTVPRDKRQTPAQSEPKEQNPQLPTFTPAKTRDEAEDFAKMFARNIEYKGISLDNCNEVNKTLYELTSKYPIRQLGDIKQNGRMKAVARANFQILEINGKKIGNDVPETWELNQTYYKSAIQAIKNRYPNGKIPADQQRQIDKYKRMIQYKRWSVAGDYGAKGTITHEFGHIIADQYWGMINGGWANSAYTNTSTLEGINQRNELLEMGQKLNRVFYEAKKNGDIYKISKYGATDKDEFFAEVFTAREMGEKLPKYISDIVEEITSGPNLQ